MLVTFILAVFAMIGALIGSDWIRHRDESIAVGLGGLVSSSFSGLAMGLSRVIGLGAGLAVVATGITGVFALLHLIG